MIELTLNLNYDLTEREIEQHQQESPNDNVNDIHRQVTQNLIRSAFQVNHRQMDADTARAYRSIDKTVGKAVDKKSDVVELSKSEFDRVYKEVYDAKYPSALGYLAPVLYDELDVLKNKKRDD